AFGSPQMLELHNDIGEISRWNLILGENGVGKTTLMQALAVMRPVPAVAEDRRSDRTSDAGTPMLSKAELSAHENNEILGLVRRNGIGTTELLAILEDEHGKRLETKATITASSAELEMAEFSESDYQLHAEGPLVIGYGAGRHIGHANLPEVSKRDATR